MVNYRIKIEERLRILKNKQLLHIHANDKDGVDKLEIAIFELKELLR